MDNISDKNQSDNRNIFSNLNFVKNNKINYNYAQCINKMKNVTDKLETLINIIDNSIGKEEPKKFKRNKNNQNKKRPMSAQIIRKQDKYSLRQESKRKLLNYSQLIYTNNEENNFRKRNNKKKI